MSELLKMATELEDYMIEHRRYLHTHPEVSNKEVKTIEYLDAELTKLGVDHVVVPEGGILCFIEGAKKGKTVLLRADVDALPMQEASENLKGPKVAVSVNDGVCHACGHDGHAAMMLGAARILLAKKDELEGNVVLMFERGEEATGNVVHLLKYIQDNNIKIDSAYGTHLYAMLESGKVSLSPGPVMAGAIFFNLKITGRGGHGSRPDQSINPIECFNAVCDGIARIRMNYANPFNALTYSIGYVRSGTVANIIPETLEFGGTVRLFDMDDGFRFKETMQKMLDKVGEAYDCVITGDLVGPGLPVKSDPECAALAQKAVAAAIGEEHIKNVEPWMASESMSYLLALWPGVFALLGIQNDELGSGAPHHNQHFDLDESVLKYGAANYAAYAIEFLKSDVDTSDRKWQGTFAEMYKYAGRAADHISYLEGKNPDFKI